MLPAALDRALRLPTLTADDFTPTKWDDANTKAKFCNNLLKFIGQDCPETMFTKAFYSRLSMTFGFIAHYHKLGFWSEYFIHRPGKIDFLDQIETCHCWGDPTFTYSDVEYVVRERVSASNVIGWHKRLLLQETERAERAQYERLHLKFNSTAVRNPQDAIGPAPRVAVANSPLVAVSPIQAGQGALAPVSQPDLFGGL